MYFESALDRINCIDWNKFGKPDTELAEVEYLGYEYLHRMAVFYSEQSVSPVLPLFTNIAVILGDTEEFSLDCCKLNVPERIRNQPIPRCTLEFYLQLAKYSDQNPNAAQYMSVYAPLIILLENGYNFAYKERGLYIYDLALYPLVNWYEKYLQAPTVDKPDFTDKLDRFTDRE